MSEHAIEDCPQEKRLAKIELVLDGTVKQLADLNLTLMEIKTLLTGKICIYDKHVDTGERWREEIFRMIVTACVTGFGTILALGIWVGTMQSQVYRLEQLHPYGTAITPINK